MDDDRPEKAGREADERPAKFRRFEKVLVEDQQGGCRPGTILWRDLVEYSPYRSPDSLAPPRTWSEWEYAVYLPDLDRCATLEESRLRTTGEFDAEEAHLGRRFEISFDTGLSEDMSTVEGTYRVPGRFWQVFLFQKDNERSESVPELRHRFDAWESGMTGIRFEVPREADLDRDYILRAFSSVFGTEDWVEVRGPDSVTMK